MKLSISSICKQMQHFMNLQVGLNMEHLFLRKDKVVFVMGATGTGKSRVAIDLATRFRAEVVNSDKMQVYKGLDIATNKVNEKESCGVPHHLLGVVDPNTDFTSADFRHHASAAVNSIASRERLPIIAGGSNSYIDALVNQDMDFRLRHEFCFLWIDVSLPVLHTFVSQRVDKMVKAGLIDEVREIFDPQASYSKGIRRAIGVPEMDEYFRIKGTTDAQVRKRILEKAISKIKDNTCMLACRQLQKIHRLHSQWKWRMHRLDATEVFLRRGEHAEEAWEELVAGPSTMIVNGFLHEDDRLATIVGHDSPVTTAASTALPAMAAATTR